MESRFRYYLKLFDGRLVYGEGSSPEEAAKDAKVSWKKVKRHMPVERIKTEAEIEASRQRVQKMLAKLEEKHGRDPVGD